SRAGFHAVPERSLTDVGRQKPAEELGICGKRGKSATTEPRAAVHTEKVKAQKGRNAGEATMRLLIEMQTVGLERACESEGLLEAEADAIAGDGVDPTGGVADQGHIVAIHALEAMHGRDRSSFAASRHSSFQASEQFRKGGKHVRDASRRARRDTSEADFAIADWRDVNLGMVFPIDLDTVGPWTETIVLPKSVALQIKGAGV